MSNFIIEAPQEGDRAERKANGLPPFKVLNYKSGKTGELYAKTAHEKNIEYFANGDVGFSYYDKEIGTVNIKEGTFALLGMFWKLNTYTGGKKDLDRWSSNMVLDIKRDEMQIYRNGEPTKYKGIYRELKDQTIWTKETKIGLFLVMMELATEKLYAIELTNTVKNGVKRAVLKAYSKPISAQSIEREGLYGLFDSPDNFHTFTLMGCNLANEKGMPYKGEKGEGDGYFMPHFQCGILRREKAPDIATKLLEARTAFFSVLEERMGAKPEAAKEAPALKDYEVPEEESLGELLARHNIAPGGGVVASSGTATAHAIANAKRDPFAEDDPNDLPF